MVAKSSNHGLLFVSVVDMYRLFLFFIIPQAIQYNNYLHSIYTVSGKMI